MINYFWNADKNRKLVAERNISFEEIILHIKDGHVLNIVENKNYPGQKFYVIDIENYVYLVPFILKENEGIFLKTIIPSRKATKQYLGGKWNV